MSTPTLDELRRVVDELRALDDRVIVGPCLAEDELAAAEQTHGVGFPDDYRAFVLEIGDGIQWPYPRSQRVLPFAQALRLSTELGALFPAAAVEASDESAVYRGCLRLGYGQALVVTGEQRGAVWHIQEIESVGGSRAAPSFEAYLRARLSEAIDATNAEQTRLEQRRADGADAHAKLGVFLGVRGRDRPRATTLLETALASGCSDINAVFVLLDAYKADARWADFAQIAARRFRARSVQPQYAGDFERRQAALLASYAHAVARLGHCRDAALAARASLGLHFHYGVLALLGALLRQLGFDERGARDIARSGKHPPVVEPAMPAHALPIDAYLGVVDGFIRRVDTMPSCDADRPSQRVLKVLPRPAALPNHVAVHSDEIDAYERTAGTLPTLYREDVLRAGSIGPWQPQRGALPGEHLPPDALVFEARPVSGGLVIGADPIDGQRVVLVDRGAQRESIWKFDDDLQAYFYSEPSYGHYLSRVAVYARARVD